MIFLPAVSKIIIAVRRIKQCLRPKRHLAGDAVVVDPSAWTKFDVQYWAPLIQAKGKTLYYCSPDDIAPADYGKICAYIGRLSPSRLSLFSERLEWLQIPSHGTNGFEHRRLYRNPGVTVSCVKDVFSAPIAQYCLTAYYLFNTFSFRPGRTAPGKCFIVAEHPTMLIMGLGNIGRELARRAAIMGWRVLGVRRHKPEQMPEGVDAVYCPTEIGDILSTADYVVNLLPDSNATAGLYDMSFFRKMKPTALFCNVGRKNAVVDKDLSEAVRGGIIRGAILDAHNDYDYATPDIILTGHSSSVSAENATKFNACFSAQLTAYLENKEVSNIITLL